MRVRVESEHLDFSDVSLGDSIAVSGTCLTMVDFDQKSFETDVSIETLSKTTLRSRLEGGMVNLEKALKVDDRLGGHLVTGHVDGVGLVVDVEKISDYVRFLISVPDDLKRFLATKGSVCIDGVSLTVNESRADQFEVMAIPHTLEITTLRELRAGDSVNIEIDIIARYLERLISERPSHFGGD